MSVFIKTAENAGFQNVADFAGAVAGIAYNRPFDDRLAVLGSSVMGNTGNSGEGFMVPADYKDQIWNAVMSDGDLLSLTLNEPTKSNRVEIVKNETTPWGATGITASWRIEGQPMSASIDPTKLAAIQLNELYAYTAATSELIEDAPLLAARLTAAAPAAIRWKASDAVMWGDGVGKPLGFMNSSALVKVKREINQSVGTILAENIANMYSRLLPSSIRNSRWLVNSTALPQLMTMKIGSQPIWTPPAAGFAEAPGGFLLGRPIDLTEHAAPLGVSGDIALVDLKGYYAPTKANGINFASSIHLLFDRGLEAFRWTFRLGGQPLLSKPVRPARGDATKSHFVVLEDRIEPLLLS